MWLIKYLFDKQQHIGAPTMMLQWATISAYSCLVNACLSFPQFECNSDSDLEYGSQYVWRLGNTYTTKPASLVLLGFCLAFSPTLFWFTTDLTQLHRINTCTA